MTDVTLKLSKPYMVYNPEKADKIVLPAEKGPLTVISGRAPTSLMLRRGVIRLLDKDNQPLKHYFIKSGVATVRIRLIYQTIKLGRKQLLILTLAATWPKLFRTGAAVAAHIRPPMKYKTMHQAPHQQQKENGLCRQPVF